MEAVSSHSFETDARPVRRRRRTALRRAVRDRIGLVVLPLLLALAQYLGAFVTTDGRFFDLFSVNGAAGSPGVVIIEQDAAFVRKGRQRFARLEASLRQLGVERVGYLDDGRAALAAPRPGRTALPVVVASAPTPSPDRDSWIEAAPPSRPAPGITPAARVIAAAQYGIYRRQFSTIPGESGPIPVFDAALAGREGGARAFYIRMSDRQSIPRIEASQVDARLFDAGALRGKVALVTTAFSAQPGYATPQTPSSRRTSEAVLRAYAVNTLRSGDAVHILPGWAMLAAILLAGSLFALFNNRIDPKRFAVSMPLVATALAALGAWASLTWLNLLLPVTALAILPWIITYDRVLARETRQDRRLEQASARAIQQSFRRSALREAANLTDYFAHAANVAGLERFIALELHEDGSINEVCSAQADLSQVVISQQDLGAALRKAQDRSSPMQAPGIVPSWRNGALLAWLGGAEAQYFWLFEAPEGGLAGKRARLVRAFMVSFREIYHWRRTLNARSQMDERVMPIDERVAGAVSLVATESQQIRHGFDLTHSAVAIFHLIGSPLHANAAMREIYAECGLAVEDSGLPLVLDALSELDPPQINALVSELVLNGGEMLLPMKTVGRIDRILRVAVPRRLAREDHRVFILEAIDTTELHRAADLRQAVALFIDLQLRNDLEAILLAAGLAADERLSTERLRPVVANMGKTARRATQRLDEVATLVRARNEHLVEACYPIDAGKVLRQAYDRAVGLAEELSVAVDLQAPGISGFTIAEPHTLAAMLEAMLRVVIADTPRGNTVKVFMDEVEETTLIRVSGGFGIGFGRLMTLMDTSDNEAVGEFRTIAEAIAKVRSWNASVSYWGREADGFGFTVNMRRIG